MPISDEEWEELDPVISNSEAIVDFLEENPSKAYTAEELRDEFSPSAQEHGIVASIFLMEYTSMLDYLSHERKVAERQLETEDEDGEMRYTSYYHAVTDEMREPQEEFE